MVPPLFWLAMSQHDIALASAGIEVDSVGVCVTGNRGFDPAMRARAGRNDAHAPKLRPDALGWLILGWL